MKRLFLLVMLLASVNAHAVASCFASATTGGSGVASTPINTNGATILIAVTSSGGSSWPLVTDSQNNVWQTTSEYDFSAIVTIQFVVNPTTSASHTITLTNATGTSFSAFPAAIFYACSGTTLDHPFAAQNGLNGSGASVTWQPGAVTPIEAGDLVITGGGNLCCTVTTATIDSGFNTPVIFPQASGHINVIASWLSAPNTSALNPTWTTTIAPWAGLIAVFKATGAAAPVVVGSPIKTFAGNHNSGFAGDGGPATSAQFDFPGEIVIDSQGNICIADVNNNRIRCINPSGVSRTVYGVTIAPGNIATVAGNGAAVFVDNVPPLSAGMIHPVGLAIDANDRIYVADQQSAAIRTFGTTGNMTTIAGRGSGGAAIGCSGLPVAGFAGDGGAATAALLDCPQGVAVNTAGTLVYVADSLNGRVRVVNLDSISHTVSGVTIAAGNIDTIFGDGGGSCGLTGAGTTSTIGQPLGIRVNSSAKITVADYNCQNVVQLNSAGVPNLLAGNGTAGHVDNVAAASAEFNGPFDVSTLPNGDIAIADSGNSAVRLWSSGTGFVSTLAGNFSVYGYTGAYWNSGGYCCDGGPANLAGLRYPVGVTADVAGNVYVGDLANSIIRLIYGPGFGWSISSGTKTMNGTAIR